MKKVISVMLTMVMLLTSSLGSAEGILKLPASLVEIGAEAFSGDSSMTVADVPYGTESISSRAFADSALTKIYIPSTVSYIAEDAFVGTNVLISSPVFSYAQTYAEQHGFEWEDSGDHYPRNVVNEAADILSSGFLLDAEKLDYPEFLSAEGETDPERLALIEEYNALVLEECALIDACNDTSALDAAAEEINGLYEVFSVEETGNGVGISFGSGQFLMDSGLYSSLQAGVSVTEAELSEDGTQMTLKAGSKEYVLCTSGNTMFLVAADAMPAQPVMLMSRSSQSFADWVFGEFESYLEKINNGMAGIDYFVALQKEHLEACFESGINRSEMKWKLGFLPGGELDDQVVKTWDKLIAIEKLEAALAKLSIPVQLAGGYVLLNNWKELEAIDAHNHPTENDLSPEAREISEKLNRDIVSLRGLYVTDAINTMVGLATSVATVASAIATLEPHMPPWLKILCAKLTAGSAAAKGVSFLAGIGLSAAENGKKSAIEEMDRSLHTTVSGYVYDATTKLPLEYVSIISGAEQVWTDSTGAYTVYLQPGEHTVTFRRDDYQDYETTITLARGDTLEKNIEMNPAGGTVTGVIRDSEFNGPLANVTILCGDRMELSSYDGSYSISLPVGEQTITYMLDDYIEQTVTLTVEENTMYVQNVWMKNKPLEPTPTPDLPATPAGSFEYTISDGKVTITKFIGSETDVVIPDKIEGYPVTTIGRSAFRACKNLTSVIIPNSVITIGDKAFEYCEGLTSVTIPNSVMYIGERAFNGCNGLTSVTIPDSVTAIGEAAFAYCYRMTSATIRAKEIGKDAFNMCHGMTRVTLSEGVTKIGDRAFIYCDSLTRVTIPESVTIGDYAFSACDGLTSVTIPEDVGWYAFRGCTSLTSVTILGGSIGWYAFYGCTSLTRVTLSEGVSGIGDWAFASCTSLTSVTIPESVDNINNHAFEGCDSLTSVTFLNGGVDIGSYVFEGCDSLTRVAIHRATNIGDWASLDHDKLIVYTDNDYVEKYCNDHSIPVIKIRI